MELLTYASVWLVLSILVAAILLEASPYYNRNSKKSGLRVAYEIALHKAEQLEILKHKWFESEKAGHDVGMKSAQESWDKLHAGKWRASKD
tara:strand:- start:725 stop:997 length:273 start_codon:yes stop_codon:yes gene_type:complete